MTFTNPESLRELATGLFQPHVVKLIGNFEEDVTDDLYKVYEAVIGAAAMQTLVAAYTGTDNFLGHLKGKSLTDPQKRAVLNILRRELRGEDEPAAYTPTPHASTTSGSRMAANMGHGAYRNYECFDCHQGGFPNYAAVQAHKAPGGGCPGKTYTCFKCQATCQGRPALDAHKPVCPGKPPAGWTPPSGQSFRGPVTPAPAPVTYTPPPAQPFIPWAPKLNLDISALPDARFAVETFPGSGEYLYFIKRTTKRSATVTAKFVWSKFRMGREYLDPGDITVRKQIGDTKELVGLVRFSNRRKHPGVYCGEFEEELQRIMQDPASAMTMYGILMKNCSYCGRSLTDPLSQARGIGPDCWDERHIPFVVTGRTP